MPFSGLCTTWYLTGRCGHQRHGKVLQYICENMQCTRSSGIGISKRPRGYGSPAFGSVSMYCMSSSECRTWRAPLTELTVRCRMRLRLRVQNDAWSARRRNLRNSCVISSSDSAHSYSSDKRLMAVSWRCTKKLKLPCVEQMIRDSKHHSNQLWLYSLLVLFAGDIDVQRYRWCNGASR